MNGKDIKHCQINKEIYAIFNEMRHQRIALPRSYINKGKKANEPT